MSREIRFLSGGIFAGLALGIVTTLAVQYRSTDGFSIAGATAIDRGKILLNANTAPDARSRFQILAAIGHDLMGLTTDGSNAGLEIRVTRNASITFSAPFVKAVRGLMADGESPDYVVDLIDTEFSSRWSAKLNMLANTLADDQFMEFPRNRDNALHQTIANLLSEQTFVDWDKHKSLGYFGGSYLLNAAESNALYRIIKDRDQRDTELVRALNAAEIDQFDFEEQKKKSDNQFDQESSNVTMSAQVIAVADDLPETLRAKTKALNLTPQQLDDLIEMERKHLEARNELEPQDPADPRANDPSNAAKLRAVDAAAEQEWMRILGPQVYADFNKALDNRYQQMKLYQKHWQLSDTDINYLYQRLAKYDDDVESHKTQTPQVLEPPAIASATQVDDFEKELNEKLKAEILPYLGEDRFRRFQAAGLIPKDEEVSPATQ